MITDLNNNITIVSVTFGICLMVCVVNFINYYKNKPENKCEHKFETFLASSTEIDNRYLSTCTKCGKQRKHRI